mmetsp:Transcript_25326/g.50446  ORF Transcript_25326/g.50446 Transcript_25326/m.50446 type:complete len:105 (+) Transcript_25326:549-863(+)
MPQSLGRRVGISLSDTLESGADADGGAPVVLPPAAEDSAAQHTTRPGGTRWGRTAPPCGAKAETDGTARRRHATIVCIADILFRDVFIGYVLLDEFRHDRCRNR